MRKYTSWWSIDDGSCEQESCSVKRLIPKDAVEIIETREYSEDNTRFRIVFHYGRKDTDGIIYYSEPIY